MSSISVAGVHVNPSITPPEFCLYIKAMRCRTHLCELVPSRVLPFAYSIITQLLLLLLPDAMPGVRAPIKYSPTFKTPWLLGRRGSQTRDLLR